MGQSSCSGTVVLEAELKLQLFHAFLLRIGAIHKLQINRATYISKMHRHYMH